MNLSDKTKTHQGPESVKWVKRRGILQAELTFLQAVLSKPIFSRGTPNTYERLAEIRRETGNWLTELEAMEPEDTKAGVAYEERLRSWLGPVFEYLAAKL